MSVVYLIQAPQPSIYTGRVNDIREAEKFGRIITLVLPGERPSDTPGPLYHALRQRLRDAGPDDYILWSGGDPAGLLLCGAVLYELGVPSIQFLKWERERNKINGQRIPTGRGRYFPVTMVFRKTEKSNAALGSEGR